MTESNAPRTHDLKCWPDSFEEMLAGRKTAEFRLNDRDYRVGDTLLIREWCPVRKEYTQREITREITHVLDNAFGLPKGYAMLSLGTAAAKSESNTTRVEVSQMARDAALLLLTRILGYPPAEPHDGHYSVQAFTRFEAEIRTAAEAASQAEIEPLRQDKERLDWLQAEMNDVRWISGHGTGMCSPSDEVGVRIVSHWQAEPRECVESENWNEDLRAAIDEARQAKALGLKPRS